MQRKRAGIVRKAKREAKPKAPKTLKRRTPKTKRAGHVGVKGKPSKRSRH